MNTFHFKSIVGLCALLCFFATLSLNAQTVAYQRLQAPKRELRAAWVATVLNIDYPQKPSANPIALKEQYRNLLDQLEAMGLNAVIVQVRPCGCLLPQCLCSLVDLPDWSPGRCPTG